jgi:hypothetical protein
VIEVHAAGGEEFQMLKNIFHLLKSHWQETNLHIIGLYSWKVIVGVQGKLRIF